MRSLAWALAATVVLLVISLFVGAATASPAPVGVPAPLGSSAHAPDLATGASSLPSPFQAKGTVLSSVLPASIAGSALHPSTNPASAVGGRWVDATSLVSGLLSQRYGSVSAYDPAMNATIVYGGLNNNGVTTYALTDTWEFKDGTWTNISSMSPTDPGPVFLSQMAWDPALGKLVLTGGWMPWGKQAAYPLTWTFSNGVWTNVTSSVGMPDPTGAGILLTDSSDHEVVLWGGGASDLCPCRDNDYTWVLSGDPATWTNITGTAGIVLPVSELILTQGSDDPASGGAVVTNGIAAGGHHPSATYLFKAGTWSNITATTGYAGSTLAVAPAVWDATEHAVVELGGINASDDLNPYTYALVGGVWTNWSATAGTAPICEFCASAAADSSGGIVIVPGVDYAASGLSTDTWQFGSPMSAVATATPTIVDVGQNVGFSGTETGGFEPIAWGWTFGDGGSSVGGTATHSYTTAGSYTATFWATDAFGYNASWTQVITVSALPVARASVSPSSTDVGRPVWFTGGVTGGSAPLSYEWSYDDGAWSSSQSPVYTYAAAGTYTAKLWVNDSVGVSSWTTVTVTVAAAPTVAATATPSSAATGTSVAFAATPTGGTGPFTYLWNFSDGSWSTASAPTHDFATAGTYKVYVTLTDAAGATANASTTVTVWAPLTVAASVNVGGGTVGTAFSFTATSSGGAGGTTYAWSESPASGLGCAASTSEALSCTSTATGTYTVTVMATDSASHTATASVVVTVTAAPSSSSSSSSGFSTDAIAVMAVLAIVAALFAVLWVTKGKGGKSSTAAPSAPAATAPAAAAPAAPAAPAPATSWAEPPAGAPATAPPAWSETPPPPPPS